MQDDRQVKWGWSRGAYVLYIFEVALCCHPIPAPCGLVGSLSWGQGSSLALSATELLPMLEAATGLFCWWLSLS